MRYFTRNNVLAFASCAALLFSACGDDSKNAGGSVEDQEIIAISDKTVTGVSQKGPFVNGSSVTVQELNGETLAQTGLGFEGKIKNDMGEFSVKVNKLESQYALLKANGFYRNEVTGEKSKSQVTLYALTDLSKRDEVNVNLLTHLAYERSLYLATEEDDVSVAEAKKQAETEVLKSFEIEGEFGDAEDLNIFGESDQSAALLAVSVLMQGNLSEGDFSERLANYAADIESDGVWNDTKTATQIADWAITQSMSGGLALIRNNIAGWNLSTGVPAFEKYVDNFWWQNYGLGTCDKEREGEVKKNQNAGSINADKYFICRSNLWYVATAVEFDTYEWKDGKDGDVKNGDAVKENCYVFEDSAWREGNANDCSFELRGCTKLRQDTVGLGSDKVWYICDAQSWRKATAYEKDTFGWKDSTDGTIKKGSVTDTIYVFDKKSWRVANEIESKVGGCVAAIADSVGLAGYSYYKCVGNEWRPTAEKLNHGTMKDSRDGQVYKTIGIGNQLWMAENLNYADSVNFSGMLGGSWCYENDESNCEKSGRLYNWYAAMDRLFLEEHGMMCDGVDSTDSGIVLSTFRYACKWSERVYQGVCPSGWHLPSAKEWQVALKFIYGDYDENQKNISFEINNEYGFFDAAPEGFFYNNSIFTSMGGYWSSTLWGKDAYVVTIEYKVRLTPASDPASGVNDAFSVRCIKDEDE